MKHSLKDEITMVASNQVFMAKQFHSDVLAEAEKINDSIENLRALV